MQRLLKAWVVVLPLFAAACATGGTSGAAGGGGGQTADALNTYNGDITTEYTATGAVVGAALGCGLGFLLTGKAAYCAAGAVAGGVAGGATGYSVSKYQEAQGLKKQSLQQTRAVLSKELDQARQARALAERLTARHKRQLADMRIKVAKGQAQRQALEYRTKAAQDDLQRLKKARSLLITQIGVARVNLKKSGTPADKKALESIRDGLVEEKAKLDAQIKILEGAIKGDPVTAWAPGAASATRAQAA